MHPQEVYTSSLCRMAASKPTQLQEHNFIVILLQIGQ